MFDYETYRPYLEDPTLQEYSITFLKWWVAILIGTGCGKLVSYIIHGPMPKEEPKTDAPQIVVRDLVDSKPEPTLSPTGEKLWKILHSQLPATSEAPNRLTIEDVFFQLDEWMKVWMGKFHDNKHRLVLSAEDDKILRPVVREKLNQTCAKQESKRLAELDARLGKIVEGIQRYEEELLAAELDKRLREEQKNLLDMQERLAKEVKSVSETLSKRPKTLMELDKDLLLPPQTFPEVRSKVIRDR